MLELEQMALLEMCIRDRLLDEQEVRLTQEQWFYLMTLGGKQLA